MCPNFLNCRPGNLEHLISNSNLQNRDLTPNFFISMNFQNERITILYGSQTGNAQDVAERIWRESKRYYFASTCNAMDAYNVLELINETCVVFVCSTTGQGEEPENMKMFWKFLLRRNLPPNSLQNLRFAVLGLGDSSYAKFNFAAKRLNKRLAQLGGQMIKELGLADDQHDLGYDAVVDPWISSLWKSLLNLYPLPVNIEPLEMNSLIQPRWNVSAYVPTTYDTSKTSPMYFSTRFSNEFFVNVTANTRVTHESHFQDVRLIKFQTNSEKYFPGDVLLLRPRNIPEQIEAFKDVLKSNGVNIPPETMVKVSDTDPQMPVPAVLKQEVTFRQLCEEYFDLSAVPRRYVFSVLSQITDSDLEKEKCLEFTSAEGQEDMYNYANRPRRNIVEVLQDFPHATKNLSLSTLFEILAPIKPREFSIASSFRKHQNEVHILVAIVKYKTKLLKERLGLASNYLAMLKNGDKLSVWVKSGCFKFPQHSENKHIIMVGPGTGMAPFRNYINECSAENVTKLNNLVFFFGCRNKDLDFYCREEFEEFARSEELNLICAFSRDQEHKIYVQDKIRENSKKVWEILQKHNSSIYIAGNAKLMPQQVREAFLDTISKHGEISDKDAQNFLANMEKSNRYQTECWS